MVYDAGRQGIRFSSGFNIHPGIHGSDDGSLDIFHDAVATISAPGPGFGYVADALNFLDVSHAHSCDKPGILAIAFFRSDPARIPSEFLKIHITP